MKLEITPPASRRRPAKPYCEAFPALSVLDAIRHWNEGRRICEWTNEHGVIVGHIVLTQFSKDEIYFEYDFFGTVNITKSSGGVKFSISQTYINSEYSKTYIVCACGRNITKIHYINERWSCRTCHGAVKLSNRLSERGKRIVTRDALAAKVAAASERQKRTRDHMNAERTLGRLTRELLALGSDRLPAQLQFRSLPRWLEHGEVPKRAASPGEPGYGWEPGQDTGLDMFRKAAEPVKPGTGLPPVDQGAAPFQHPATLIGSMLFGKAIIDVLQDLFSEQAWSVATGKLGRARWASEAQLAAKVKKATKLSRLVLVQPWVSIDHLKLDTGENEVRGVLRFLGTARLWFARPEGVDGMDQLRAMIGDGEITLAVRYANGDERAARVALDVAKKAIWDQVQAQLPTIAVYQNNLVENSQAFAAMCWKHHAKAVSRLAGPWGGTPFAAWLVSLDTRPNTSASAMPVVNGAFGWKTEWPLSSSILS